MLTVTSLTVSIILGVSNLSAQSTCNSKFTPRYNENGTSPLTASVNDSVKVVSSSDIRYDELRRHANNHKFLSNAAIIATPKTSQEVVHILNEAVATSRRPTVRSGGHCYEDFWSENPNGILIDLSSMDKVETDANGTIWVEAGAKSGRVYEILYKEFGFAVPGSVCVGVAIGGLVTGGGYGYLVRKYGLLVDYVDKIEVAHVKDGKTAQLITVSDHSPTEERNLFWGLLGGGTQNFGIVTKVAFKNLPTSPPLIHHYEASWRLGADISETHFSEFMGNYTKFFENNSGVDSEYCDILADLNVHRDQDIGGGMSLGIIVIGDKRHLVEKFLEQVGFPYDNFTCSSMTYYQFAYINGYPVDVKTRGDYYTRGSAYMVGKMPQHQIETLWRYMTDSKFSSVFHGEVQIRSYGCAVSRKAEAETAYPHRTAKIKMQYGVHWQKENETYFHNQYFKDFYFDMYGSQGPKSDGVMDGCYVNYPYRELVDWQHLYYKGNYERLQQVKKQWDPHNIYRHRQSVELP